MTTRRSFIRLMAGTVPAALAAPAIADARVPRGISACAPRVVIVDEAHASAQAFGARVASRGTTVLTTQQGDVTALWLEHLRPLWTSNPTPVAGLTLPGTLFCLEQLAWQHRMRVVFHAEHLLLPDRRIEHTVHRDEPSRRLTTGVLIRAGEHWPQRLVDALVRHRPPRGTRSGPSLAALEPALPAGATLFTSWIIA
jgi:hypothetical protein